MSSQFVPSKDLISIFASSIKEQTKQESNQGLSDVQFSLIGRSSGSSSLGLFDLLPPELFTSITDMLDLQSLSRLARTSLKGKTIVEELLVYQALVDHAPTTFAALGKCGLAGLHPVWLIHQTLRSDRCVKCPKFGGYVFLPSFERACLYCLAFHKYFSVSDPARIEVDFALTAEDMKQIPQMRSLISDSWASWGFNDPDVLVSVMQAAQVWDRVYGGLKEPHEEIEIWKAGAKKYDSIPSFWLHAEEDEERICAKGIRFPFLADYGVEHGFECRKCKEESLFHREPIPNLFTRVELWDHSKSCVGVPGFLERLEKEQFSASSSG